MKSAITDFLFSIISFFIFSIALLTLFNEINNQQELVKEFSNSNYVRDELILQNQDSPYWDYYENGQWVQPKIQLTSAEILNEIYALDHNIDIYIQGNQISKEAILYYHKTNDASVILNYLNNHMYIKEYVYDGTTLSAIKYSYAP